MEPEAWEGKWLHQSATNRTASGARQHEWLLGADTPKLTGMNIMVNDTGRPANTAEPLSNWNYWLYSIFKTGLMKQITENSLFALTTTSEDLVSLLPVYVVLLRSS